MHIVDGADEMNPPHDRSHREQARDQRIRGVILARPDQHVTRDRLGAVWPPTAGRDRRRNL